jgi:hypothetical protein
LRAPYIITVSVLVAGVGHVSHAQAKFGVSIEPGSEVRITPRISEARVRGRLVSLAGDTLRIQPSGPAVTFRLDELRRLEVRGGQARGKGVLLGIVAAEGFVMALALKTKLQNECCVDLAPDMIVAAPIGAVVGYFAAPRGWLEVPIPRS